MVDVLESADFSETVFKKKIKKLEQFSGRGTELISVYIPFGTDRSSIAGQLTEEISQSSNIKSPTTRKNVQAALRKIISFLKQIDFKLPETGLVVFAGNVSETEGRQDIRLFTIRPIKDLRTKLYWCDSRFHLEPLKEMIKPSSVYGLVAIDRSEATIAVLSGKRYEILGKFTSGYSGKMRAGGQSAQRFERLREEAEQEFYKRISEKLNYVFLPYGDKLQGIIVGGPGMAKQFFIDKGLIDHRLRQKIIAVVDISYTDEGGIRELMQRSDQVLKDTEIIKERKVLSSFFEALAKNDLAAYGEKEVIEALNSGMASVVLVSEGIDWNVFKLLDQNTGEEQYFVDKGGTQKIPERFEVIEEMEYIDYISELASRTSAKVHVISVESPEGEQFFKGFGGLGAILRYKLK